LLALFPGHSYLQSLIACSITNMDGRPGHVVISGRRRIDTWGVVPDEESHMQPFLVLSV